MGPTAIGTSASNVVIGTIDLNGSDLLASVSGDALFLIEVKGLAYRSSASYPHSFVYEVCVEKFGGTYTIHHSTKIADRLTGGLTVGPVTMNFAITSTSVFNVRMSNTDAITFTGLAYVFPIMWHP